MFRNKIKCFRIEENVPKKTKCFRIEENDPKKDKMFQNTRKCIK